MGHVGAFFVAGVAALVFVATYVFHPSSARIALAEPATTIRF